MGTNKPLKRLQAMSGPLILALNDALQKSLHLLARKHDGTAWLDVLEKSVIADLKEVVAEGLSLEDEADGIRFAIDHLENVFAQVRAQL